MIATGSDYHRSTSYHRHRMEGHFLDWSNQPDVYKDYPGQRVISLLPGTPERDHELSLVAGGTAGEEGALVFSLERLSLVLDLAYGFTARSLHGGREFYYRSAPSAGALYPCELYVTSRALTGLPEGLYHYSLAHRGLVLLRSGTLLASGVPGRRLEPTKVMSAFMFFVTAIFFRSTWKYRARAYRYHLMDSGHLLENLLLALKSLTYPAVPTYDFNDRDIDTFLGCDTEREGCLAMVTVGSEEAAEQLFAERQDELPAAVKAASRVAPEEISYPVLQEMHAAASRVRAPAADLIPDMIEAVGGSSASWQPLPVTDTRPDRLGFEEAVRRRRSRRNFIREPLPLASFQVLAELLCGGNDPAGECLRLHEEAVAAGFLIGSVEGLEPGIYWLDHSHRRLGMAKAGDFLGPMAHACLDQEWLAGADLHVFLAANLEVLDRIWGPRGYRYAMLTAGRLGQRVYLGASSLGLGCCGIGAFYDGEAATLLGLNETSSMFYLLGVGPVKRGVR